MPGEELENAVCRHHWIIEAPTGPVSVGVCRLCEEVREFKNYIESAPWVDDTSAGQTAGRYSAATSSDDSEELEEA